MKWLLVDAEAIVRRFRKIIRVAAQKFYAVSSASALDRKYLPFAENH